MKQFFIIVFLFAYVGVIAQTGITKYGESTTTSSNFVSTNGAVGGSCPKLTKYGEIILPVGFKTEWVVAGDATARTITLPLYNSGTFNCTVIWGDGTANSTVTTYNSANRIHTYAANGTYDVEIQGECPAWSFNWTGDSRITKIVDWGNCSGFGGFKYLSNGFYGCTNLTISATDKILSILMLNKNRKNS